MKALLSQVRSIYSREHPVFTWSERPLRHSLSRSVREPSDQQRSPEHTADPMLSQTELALRTGIALRGFVRNIVGAGASSFDRTEILDRGGVCLVRVPKGVLGKETARLLGSFVVAKTWQAATARAGQPERTRRDATLYVEADPHCIGNAPAGGSVAGSASRSAYGLRPADVRQGKRAGHRPNAPTGGSPDSRAN